MRSAGGIFPHGAVLHAEVCWSVVDTQAEGQARNIFGGFRVRPKTLWDSGF